MLAPLLDRLPLAALIAIAALGVSAASASAADVVISEVQTGLSPTEPDAEFIELLNTSQTSQDISGWVVERDQALCDEGGTFDFVPQGVVLAPGQRYLLATSPDASAGVQPDQVLLAGDQLAELGGSLSVGPSGLPVDLVGYGAAMEPCAESAAALPPSPGSSIERENGGSEDTDNNLADFGQPSTPTPQNRAATAPPPPPPDGGGGGGGDQPGQGTPPPPAPSGPAQAEPGPTILSATFSPRSPRAGQPVRLVVRAQHEGFRLAGVRADFAEPRAQVAESACQLPVFSREFALGRALRFVVPHEFTTPGVHDVVVTVVSGSCTGVQRSTTTTVRVDVRPAGGARASAARAAGGSATGQAAQRGGCPGANAAVRKANVKAAARATLCLINLERRKRRLKPLSSNARLGRAARGHSTDMVRRTYFAHEHPSGPGLAVRFRKVRYRGAGGENIAFDGRATPRKIVGLWMNSPPHRANILARPFRAAGVGVVSGSPLQSGAPGGTFTTNFGSKR